MADPVTDPTTIAVVLVGVALVIAVGFFEMRFLRKKMKTRRIREAKKDTELLDEAHNAVVTTKAIAATLERLGNGAGGRSRRRAGNGTFRGREGEVRGGGLRRRADDGTPFEASLRRQEGGGFRGEESGPRRRDRGGTFLSDLQRTAQRR